MATILFAGGFWTGKVVYDDTSRGKILRAGADKLINPLLSCEIADKKEFTEFQPLADAIGRTVDEKVTNGLANAISVYFRALNSGRWVGINEDQKFSPASLLKIPNMIAYLKLAETDPAILSKRMLYAGGEGRNELEDIKPSTPLIKNTSYTVEELITHMIAYSDNDARLLLMKNFDPNSLNEIYSDLGIDMTDAGQVTDFMSAKTYASFFRILYSATYLSKVMSEKALEILSATDFQGIPVGVPSGITVAHKFGERTILSPQDSHSVVARELHDCGIVYYPKHPYLICIMTKGRSFKDLQSVIADIARLVYIEADHFFQSGK